MRSRKPAPQPATFAEQWQRATSDRNAARRRNRWKRAEPKIGGIRIMPPARPEDES